MQLKYIDLICYIIFCVAVVLDPEYKIALACWTGNFFKSAALTKDNLQ